MRASSVVVSLILCQDRPQMPLAVEEHPVGDLRHIPPELIRLLRVHIKRYGTTSAGVSSRPPGAGIIQGPAYSIVWADARTGARRTVSHTSRRLRCTKGG